MHVFYSPAIHHVRASLTDFLIGSPSGDALACQTFSFGENSISNAQPLSTEQALLMNLVNYPVREFNELNAAKFEKKTHFGSVGVILLFSFTAIQTIREQSFRS